MIVAIALGIVGVVAKGLLFLLIIGIVVFLGALTLAALQIGRRPGRHPASNGGHGRLADADGQQTGVVAGVGGGVGHDLGDVGVDVGIGVVGDGGGRQLGQQLDAAGLVRCWMERRRSRRRAARSARRCRSSRVSPDLS